MQEREGAFRRGGEGGSIQERGRGREHAGEGEREGACRRGGKGGSMQERGRGREHAGEGEREGACRRGREWGRGRGQYWNIIVYTKRDSPINPGLGGIATSYGGRVFWLQL